jgi:hypothetical protein
MIALGAVAAASPCLGDLAWAQELALGAAAPIVELPLSLGYVEGSDAFRSLRRLPAQVRRPGAAGDTAGDRGLRVVPARELWAGDPEMVGPPLRLRIAGLYPPAALASGRRSELPFAIDLDVLFPAPEPAIDPHPLRFAAWSFRRRPWNLSPPVAFNFPLDWEALPEIEVRVVPARREPARAFTARFTLDDETGRPRLRRGVYLLGLSAGAWDGPRPLAAMGKNVDPEAFSVLISVEPTRAD